MSKVKYYSGGGANSIGKSFSLLVFDDEYYLGMDWGGGYDSIYREPQYNGQLDCLFISHAHLDHCIQVPSLRKRYPKTRMFSTLPTAELCLIGWNQTLHLAKENNIAPPFTGCDIMDTRSSIEIIEVDHEVKLTNDLSVFPLSAGHILGAISLLIVYKKEIFFLTSDMSFQDRHLIKGATEISFEKTRLLVRESTYINKPFEDRKKVISDFTGEIKDVLKRGGRVLVPALSVDRMQDVFAVCAEAGISPIYLDGSKGATEIYIKYLGSQADSLRNAMRFENKIHRRKFLASKKSALIIATSGMIHPGTLSSEWARHFLPNRRDAVFMVNFQDPDGQGAMLSKTKAGDFLVFNGSIVKRACDVKHFNFSAHMSGEDGTLLEARFNPETVIYNHGQDSEIEKYIQNSPKDRRRIKAQVGKFIEV